MLRQLLLIIVLIVALGSLGSVALWAQAANGNPMQPGAGQITAPTPPPHILNPGDKSKSQHVIVSGSPLKPVYPSRGPVYQSLKAGETVELVKQNIVPYGNLLLIEDRQNSGFSFLQILTGMVSLILCIALLWQAVIFVVRSHKILWLRLLISLSFAVLAFGILIALYALGGEYSYHQWCEISSEKSKIECFESRWLGRFQKSVSTVEISKERGGLYVFDIPRPRLATAKAGVPEYVLFYSENLGMDKYEITQDIGEYKTIFQVGEYIADLMGLRLVDTALRSAHPGKPKSGKSHKFTRQNEQNIP